ncbi:MAG: methionine--tRNA ligase [Patescibacteria group bacterium]|jgi:methionyl-tRNA synthetase|nr:methionine--tRNA ligase [bacterium]HQC49651.1 methionine--tRNA ligase [bacterium]
MKNNNFYITTTLPYINSEPHIGFAAEIIRADVIARYERQQGREVFFNTGTDEHGLKIYLKAQEEGLSVNDYCDKYSAKFLPLKESLNLTFDKFIRTTDAHHIAAAQEFWRRCAKQGDIYKKHYEVKYCVGCEMEKTDSELVSGRCPLHPNQDLEIIKEENYFFRFSKYQEKLLDLYKSQPDFVLPASRLKEINTFVANGLQDFSISRQKDKMPHGVPVPDDDSQVMYVWFDALVNYVSTLGWPEDEANFLSFWPALQVCGKDNLRPQAAMWQAMLMSAGLPSSKQILVFGFITANGEKMSKSLGNVVSPFDLVAQYGSEAVRYYLLAEIPTFEDGDYSNEKFKIRYNADLANGLGNLVSRVANLLEKNEIKTEIKIDLTDKNFSNTATDFKKAMNGYRLNEALHIIWDRIRACDETLSAKTPWKLSNKKEIAAILKPLAQDIVNIAYLLEPFLPSSAKKIQEQFLAPQIKKGAGLFPRLE